MHPIPKTCPECGSARIAKVLWRYCDLSDDEAREVAEGQTILGLNYRYFSQSNPDPSSMEPLHGVAESALPNWACLHCKEYWLRLHELAMEELPLLAAKDAAAAAQDIESTVAIHESQERLEQAHAQEVRDILRLVAQEIEQRLREFGPAAESNPEPEITPEERTKIARAILKRLGSRRFGKPTAEHKLKLDEISDVERLEQLTDRVLDATSWDDLFEPV